MYIIITGDLFDGFQFWGPFRIATCNALEKILKSPYKIVRLEDEEELKTYMAKLGRE